MSEYYVDLRLIFKGEPDEYEEDYEVIELTHIEHVQDNLPVDKVEGVVESMAQSDFAYIGLPAALVAAIEGGKHEVDKRIY